MLRLGQHRGRVELFEHGRPVDPVAGQQSLPVKHHGFPELSALQVEKRSPADDGVLDAPVPGFYGWRREARHRDLGE